MVQGLVDKLKMGIDVPIYPQFRDMNGMFVEMMDGIGKMQGTFHVMEKPTLRYTLIPEVSALREQAKVVAEIMGGSVQAGICVTGPYTLSSLFAERSPDIFDLLGDVIKEIVESNVFSEKNLEIKLFTLDEPVFGLVDDARIDLGSEGRERLVKVWESIFSCAKLKGADTSIHLHSTSNSLFFEVGSLDVIGCNVGDPLYSSGGMKRALEKHDKFLNVSICKTNFDELIAKKKPDSSGEELARVWDMIRNGKVDPIDFLEDVESMGERLKKVVEFVGIERLKYASPECGLGTFPSYRCALEYLYRSSEVVKKF